VEFYVLSLPEAAMVYIGLAIQAIIRMSSLRHLPKVMVLLWTLVLLWRAGGHPGGYRHVVGYVGVSLIILILFWPEVVPFGQVAVRPTDPSQVASYAASQDPGAQIITAQDTGQVPNTLSNPALVAPGFRLLLRAITETPLALAKAINSQAQRTFANVMPMQWLLGVQLTAPVTAAIHDWVSSCYVPVVTNVLAANQAQTQEDLLPWNGSVVAQALAARQVPPGRQQDSRSSVGQMPGTWCLAISTLMPWNSKRRAGSMTCTARRGHP